MKAPWIILLLSVSVLLGQGVPRGERPVPRSGAGGVGSPEERTTTERESSGGSSERTPARTGFAPRNSGEASPGEGASEARGGSDQAGIRSLIQGLEMRSSSLNWRGKSFNLGDPEVVKSRFERYLNIPPATSAEDVSGSHNKDGNCNSGWEGSIALGEMALKTTFRLGGNEMDLTWWTWSGFSE